MVRSFLSHFIILNKKEVEHLLLCMKLCHGLLASVFKEGLLTVYTLKLEGKSVLGPHRDMEAATGSTFRYERDSGKFFIEPSQSCSLRFHDQCATGANESVKESCEEPRHMKTLTSTNLPPRRRTHSLIFFIAAYISSEVIFRTIP